MSNTNGTANNTFYDEAYKMALNSDLSLTELEELGEELKDDLKEMNSHFPLLDSISPIIIKSSMIKPEDDGPDKVARINFVQSNADDNVSVDIVADCEPVFILPELVNMLQREGTEKLADALAVAKRWYCFEPNPDMYIPVLIDDVVRVAGYGYCYAKDPEENEDIAFSCYIWNNGDFELRLDDGKTETFNAFAPDVFDRVYAILSERNLVGDIFDSPEALKIAESPSDNTSKEMAELRLEGARMLEQAMPRAQSSRLIRFLSSYTDDTELGDLISTVVDVMGHGVPLADIFA